MLTPKGFACRQCGRCCMAYTVKLSDEDIKNIEKLGYKRGFFAEPDSFDIKAGKYALKRIDNKCIFLIERNKKHYCKIYEFRPEICRDYPFNESRKIESCEPEKRGK